MRRAALMTLLLMWVAPWAHAQSHSVSYSVWSISDRSVILRFLVPATEAARLTGSDIPVLTSSKLADYVLKRVGVDAAGEACTAIDQGYDIGQVDPLAVGAQLYGFEIVFHCPAAAPLVLHDRVLFDRVPSHVNFARVQFAERFSEQVFSSGSQSLRISNASQLGSAGIARYARLGAAQLLYSSDRLCFLLAAFLLLLRRQDGVRLLVALSIGYALSIVLNAAGWVAVRPNGIDAAIGLLVALLAGAFVIAHSARPVWVARVGAGIFLLLAAALALSSDASAALLPLGGALLAGGLLALALRGNAQVCWSVAAVLLGLLDGALLPSLLTPLALSDRIMLPMQIGYDLGVLLTDAVLLAVGFGVLAWVTGRRIGRYSAITADITAAALSGLGVFWLASRLHA